MSDIDIPVYPDLPQTLPPTEWQNDSTAHPAMQPLTPGPDGAITGTSWDDSTDSEPPPDPGPPDPGVSVDDITPKMGLKNSVTHVVITGTGLTNTKQVFIGKSCHNTLVPDDNTITTDTPGNQGAGVFDVIVQMNDNSQAIGPQFTYT